MRIFFVVSVLSLLSYLPIYAQSTTPDPLTILQEGNKRFVQNELAHPNQSMSTVEALKGGQQPFAIIVSCSDSRVTPEIVFDRGLGDLFSIRTAGNVMSDYEEGSIEYAAQHLGTKLVVVMGHQGCGAVKAFLDYADHNDKAHDSHAEIAGHVKSIIEKMNSEEEEIAVLSEDGEHYEKAVVANVINGVKQLRNSDPILAKMYKNGEINIVGAIYHIDNGQVEFLNY